MDFPRQKLMMLETLRRTEMFSGLPAEALRDIAEGCRLLNCPKGSYLFMAGEVPEGFFVIQSGSINVHRVTPDGREQVIRVFYPGESLAEVVLAHGGAFPASAVAVENSQVVVVPRRFFREKIMSDPDLALRILASMSQHLKFLVETVEDLKLKQAECRLAQWMLRQAKVGDPDGGVTDVRFTLPTTKRLLASQLGITSETFSRVLSRFRDDKTISVDGKEIIIHSPQTLAGHALAES